MASAAGTTAALGVAGPSVPPTDLRYTTAQSRTFVYYISLVGTRASLGPFESLAKEGD